MYLVIFAAIAPVVVLLWQILKRDSANPEPPKMLMKAFLYGMISTAVTFVLLPFTEALGDLIVLNDTALSVAFKQAFFSAALPEEGAKLLMLWLLLRNNPYFDERFDGIVYVVCVGMGFAAVENVLYLFNNYDSWLSVGIVRALFAVPGHFFDAVIMGYYYSHYHFGTRRNPATKALILAAPVVAHGIYDGILFSYDIDNGVAVVALILFLIFFNRLKKTGRRLINELNV